VRRQRLEAAKAEATSQKADFSKPVTTEGLFAAVRT
jgi:hypothetical protein